MTLVAAASKSPSNDTSDERNPFEKIHRALRSRLCNEPETDSLIDPLEDFARDSEDHLSSHLGPDIDPDALQDIQCSGTR